MKNLIPLILGGLVLAVVAYIFIRKSGSSVATATGVPGQPIAIPVGQPCKLSDNSQGVVGPNGQCVTQSSVSAVTSGISSLLNPLTQAGTAAYAASR